MKKMNLLCLLATSASLSLVGCNFNTQNSQETAYSTPYSTTKVQVKKHEVSQEITPTQSVKKTTVSSTTVVDPVQKSTPGPKRVAAPQIPVIQ